MKIDDKNNSGCGNVFWDVVTYKNMGEIGSIWKSRKDVGFTIKKMDGKGLSPPIPPQKTEKAREASPHTPSTLDLHI